MMYEAYEKKVRGYLPLARICKICVKCAVLLLILGAVLLLGYLCLRGIHFGEYTLQSETVAFGDKPEYDCFVLLGTYRCEYAAPGSEDWAADQPTSPGEYRVRAVITKGLFGKKIYSEAGTIILYRRQVTLYPESKRGASVEYGNDPVFGTHWQIDNSLLAKGHSVQSAALTYYTYDGRGGAICHIDPDSVVICDRKGNDVTAGYLLDYRQGTVKVKAKQITVVVADEIKNGKPVNITKTYDGRSASTANYEITKGSLYSGDCLYVTPHSISADVGKHNNSVTVTVQNGAGQDRTAYYNIKVDVCKVIVEKRPLSVTTPDVTLEYTGQTQYTDAYDIVSGSLAPGQYATFVHNSKTGILEVTSRPQDNRVQLQIMADGRDVTKNYDITYTYGSLTVKPRVLRLQSENSSGLVYNGRAQSWTDYRVMSGSLAAGHSVKVKKAATQTVPGSCVNEVEYEILSADGKKVTENYDLSVSYGTLTVEKGAPLMLALNDLRKTYDASPLDPADYSAEETVSVLGGTLFADDYIEIVSTSGFQTDAGHSTYSVQYRIMHKEGLGKAVDATDWYASRLSGNGNLTVDKRTLVISFDPQAVRYNGQSVSAVYPDAMNSDNEFLKKYEGKGHKIVLDANAFYQNLTYTKDGKVVSAPTDAGRYSYTVPTELFSVVLNDGSGADRTHNYEFTFKGNTIEIQGIPVTLTAPGGSKVYDGTPLSAEDFSLSEVKVEFGYGKDEYQVSFTLYGSQTGAGTGSLTVQNVQVWDKRGNNVTASASITTVPGKLTVTPVSISVRSSSGNKVYDGQPMDNATQMTLVSGSLIVGHVLGGAVKSDYITDVGTHDNDRVTPKVYSATGQDVSGNYLITVKPGRYTVTPAALHIEAPLVQGEYTGEAYNGTCDATASAAGLAKGQKVTLYVTSDGVELGVHSMTIRDGKVTDARGRDVTGNYVITFTDGEIEIVPRKIKVITGSSMVAYDKVPARNTDVRAEGSGLLPGHEIRATFTYPNGITDIGQTVQNSLESVRVVDQRGNDVTAYYEITTTFGMLRVNPINITVKTGSESKPVYDGQPISSAFYEVSAGKLLEGHVLHVQFKYAAGVSDVGKWKNELSSIRITDRDGKDVSYMYNVKVDAGILEIISPYELPMQSFDAQKVYDGTPLSNERYELHGELLPGHAIADVTPVTVDLVGEKENRLSLVIVDADGKDVSKNYAFTYGEGMLGTLLVTHRVTDVVIDADIVLTYNGSSKLLVPQAQITCSNLVQGQRISLPMLVESPEIGRKYDYAFGDMRIYDARGRDVTHCYRFEVPSADGAWLQSVVVEPALLQLYLPQRYTKEYDGKGVDVTLAGYRPMGLASGHRVEYQATAADAEPGTYVLEFLSWAVYDQYGEDVTANYTVTPSTCTVEIYKLYVSVSSAGASRHYNGQPLICHELLKQKLPEGFTLDVVYTGTQTAVGKSDNTFDVTVYDAQGNDVTEYCTVSRSYGTLEVWDQIELVLQSGSASAIYDGSTLTCHELGKYTLPEGYTLDVVFTGERTLPGESENTFEVTVYDANGEDVTASFAITKKCGTLRVIRAEDWVVTLRSESATKNYDGTPLSMHVLAPYELPRGFYLDVTFTGEQTEIGSSTNTFTARVYNDAGQELQIAYEYGTLQVSLDITVNAYEMTYTYDGTEKNCEDVWVQGLPEGYRVEVEFGAGLIVVGSKNVEFKSVRVYDAEGRDVTELCNRTLKTAKLTVLPRTLTVYVYGQSADSITPVQGSLVEGHTMFAEYGEGGECYIEIADQNGELVYSNRGDSPVRYTLYDVIVQYG